MLAPHACFACGELNEHGLHLDLHVDAETCWTELEIPAAFQGWDDVVHGGIVATILDEVMAWALASSDAWGFTARMSVMYRRPVTVGRRIRAEGWLVTHRRRLLTTAARLVDAGTGIELATAEGLYVAAPEKRKRELKARYGYGDRPAAHNPPGSVDAALGSDGVAAPRGPGNGSAALGGVDAALGSDGADSRPALDGGDAAPTRSVVETPPGAP